VSENRTCIIDSKGYKTLAYIIAITMGLFQIFVSAYGLIVINMRCAIFLTFSLTLIGMNKPARFKNSILTDVYNICFTLLGCACGCFLVYETRSEYVLTYMLNGPSKMDLIVGTIILILIILCTRRMTGNALPIICGIFVLYAMYGHLLPGLLTHKRYKWKSIVDVIIFTSEGLYGQPLSIASSYVAAFVLFGSFLSITGAGQWFIDMAYSLTGRFRSGPAMTAVVSSAAMGTISGTGVANVVTTGAFTIPLMKSCGYSATMSGAVEAVASTGGQIMPPVMGAAAFILADMIGIAYGEVAMAAILPALLYFLACAFQVDFEAGRLGMKGLGRDELPSRMGTFKRGWFYLIPVIILIWALCIQKYSANYSALFAIAAVLVVGFVFCKGENRLNFKKILQALADAARDMLSIAMACATAGVMIGVLTKTGLGLKFTSLLLAAAGGQKLPTLVLTMLCCVILGMGLPTTAAFIITATLCAPAAIELGVTPLASYMFVFYYACLSAITPPVALSAYAAASLSGASALSTGLVATRLGLAGFLIPYFFCYSPAMLLQGDILSILQVSITSIIGVYLLAAGLVGYMWRPLKVYERGLLIAAALLMVDSGLITDVIGIAVGIFIVVPQLIQIRKQPAN